VYFIRGFSSRARALRFLPGGILVAPPEATARGPDGPCPGGGPACPGVARPSDSPENLVSCRTRGPSVDVRPLPEVPARLAGPRRETRRQTVPPVLRGCPPDLVSWPRVRHNGRRWPDVATRRSSIPKSVDEPEGTCLNDYADESSVPSPNQPGPLMARWAFPVRIPPTGREPGRGSTG
jgi:hypothetical protein